MLPPDSGSATAQPITAAGPSDDSRPGPLSSAASTTAVAGARAPAARQAAIPTTAAPGTGNAAPTAAPTNSAGPMVPPTPPTPRVTLVARILAAANRSRAPVLPDPVAVLVMTSCPIPPTWGTASTAAPISTPPTAGRAHSGHRHTRSAARRTTCRLQISETPANPASSATGTVARCGPNPAMSGAGSRSGSPGRAQATVVPDTAPATVAASSSGLTPVSRTSTTRTTPAIGAWKDPATPPATADATVDRTSVTGTRGSRTSAEPSAAEMWMIGPSLPADPPEPRVRPAAIPLTPATRGRSGSAVASARRTCGTPPPPASGAHTASNGP